MGIIVFLGAKFDQIQRAITFVDIVQSKYKTHHFKDRFFVIQNMYTFMAI